MFERIRDELQAGEFHLELTDCTVTQCVNENPIIFKGVGFITQAKDCPLNFVLVCQSFEGPYDRYDSLSNAHVSGRLIADHAQYTISGVDHAGNQWRAEHQLINRSHAHGLQISSTLSEIEGVTAAHRNPNDREYCGWYFANDLKIPFRPKQTTITSDFDDWGWRGIKDHHDNVEIRFNAPTLNFEERSEFLLRGVSLLAGQSLTPLCTWHIKGESETVRVISRGVQHQKSGLLPLVPREWPRLPHWNAFLDLWINAKHATVARPVQEIIYHYYHRILKAYQDDMENCVQVMASSIEGIIVTLYKNEDDVDKDFVAILEDAVRVISDSGIAVDSRALGVLQGAIKNNNIPKMKVAFRRLVDSGVLTKDMLKAWDSIRNKTAHGDLLPFTDDATQRHLDGFFTCYEAFKRIIFDQIGYKGTHIDYSTAGWPVIEPISQVATDDVAVTASCDEPLITPSDNNQSNAAPKGEIREEAIE